MNKEERWGVCKGCTCAEDKYENCGALSTPFAVDQNSGVTYECPCISCIVKMVCEQGCVKLDEYREKHKICINQMFD